MALQLTLPKVQNTSTTAKKVSGSLQLTFRKVTNMLLEGVVRIVSYVHVPLCDSLTNLKEISSWVMIAALFQPNSSITLVTPSTAQDSEGTVWKDEEKRCRSLSASEEDAYETWSGDMMCVMVRDIYSIAVYLAEIDHYNNVTLTIKICYYNTDMRLDLPFFNIIMLFHNS